MCSSDLLPKMDQILQRVVGSKIISLLDGFSGYNQVLVHPDDQQKNRFHYTLGHLHVCQNSFLVNECGGYFSKSHGHSVF